MVRSGHVLNAPDVHLQHNGGLQNGFGIPYNIIMVVYNEQKFWYWLSGSGLEHSYTEFKSLRFIREVRL